MVTLLHKGQSFDRESSEAIYKDMIPSVSQLPYEQRLAKLHLWKLEDRRIRADIIELYKSFMDCLLLNSAVSLNVATMIVAEVTL